jgi:hypothetical protein
VGVVRTNEWIRILGGWALRALDVAVSNVKEAPMKQLLCHRQAASHRTFARRVGIG